MRNSTKIALSTLTLAAVVSAALAQGVSPAAALAKLGSKVYSTGPNGEQPASASSVTLTPAEIAKVKDMKATAAIVLHYGGNDWSNAQVDGLKARFAELGVTVIAVTDAGFKPEKQVSDLETVSARKPSVIVSIPTDPVATASEYKKVAAAGIKLVFMDNVPKGMTAGKDYTSVVSSDNYGNGIASAHLMAQALGSKGNIGIIYHSADFFVTKQRYMAFKATIKQFPNIKVLDIFYHKETPQDAVAKIEQVMQANPDITGWGLLGGWPLFTDNALKWQPGTVKCVCVDALPQQLPYVRSGHVQLLLSQDVYGYGYKSVDHLVNKLHLKKDPALALDNSPLTPVTRDNVDAFAKNWEKWLPK